MSGKRPTKGVNTRGRDSCLTGKNKRFKDMLDQQSTKVDHKLIEKKERQKQQKAMQRKVAHDLQVEHGMIDRSQAHAAMADTRRQHKIFLDALFVPSTTSVLYNGQRVFRTKESMQLYYQRVVDTAEWHVNLDRLGELKEKHYAHAAPIVYVNPEDTVLLSADMKMSTGMSQFTSNMQITDDTVDGSVKETSTILL